MLSEVKFIFDEVCEEYVKMTHYLSADAHIVTLKPSEKALVNIIDGRGNDLDDKECDSFQAHEIDVMESNVSDTHKSNMSYFQQIQS